MLKLVLKEWGVDSAHFSLRALFYVMECLVSLTVTLAATQLSAPLRSYALPGVGDLMFLELRKFHILIFWTSHCAAP